jgi:integrase
MRDNRLEGDARLLTGPDGYGRGTTRSGAGEGSIMRRRDGRWWARVELERVGGKRKRKFLYGHSREEVAKKLAATLVAHHKGEPVPTERLSVGGFMREWLDSVRPPVLRPRTHLFYQALNRLHIEPRLGTIQLTKLYPQTVQQLLNDNLAGDSRRRACDISVRYCGGRSTMR